jgi:hypothetical protein
MAAVSLPWAVVVRCVPDERFGAVVRVVGKPFMAVYRVLVMMWSRVVDLLSRSSAHYYTDMCGR